MSVSFYGREKEMGILRERLESQIASLIVIKGRRRIGKSRLAEEFSRPFRTITLEGLPPKDEIIDAQMQRTHFANGLERQLGIRGLKADDWDDLFWSLSQSTSAGRVIIIFDEINWMGSKDPTFLGKLKTAWDNYFKKNSKLILILSGSMSGWIEENILSSTGFHGRVSLTLTLQEMPLHECNNFWRPLEKNISSFEKFKILSVTGGVPRYLEEINPKLSADEMIYRLCFRPQGLLYQEFERIFSDLFSKRAPIYKSIVKQLALQSLSLQQICDALKIEKGGLMSNYLSDLEETQYIQRYHTWNLNDAKPSKLSLYRIKDNYIRFYLKYIEPNMGAIEREAIKKVPAWEAIMGLQFETLVFNNFKSLYPLLSIHSEEILQEGPFFQTKSQIHRGCQIDYLIQLKYNSLYVCEIKYCSRPIGMDVVAEVQEKIDRIHLPKHRYSIRPVLIHVNGVASAVENSSFFTHILNFSQLL